MARGRSTLSIMDDLKKIASEVKQSEAYQLVDKPVPSLSTMTHHAALDQIKNDPVLFELAQKYLQRLESIQEKLSLNYRLIKSFLDTPADSVQCVNENNPEKHSINSIEPSLQTIKHDFSDKKDWVTKYTNEDMKKLEQEASDITKTLLAFLELIKTREQQRASESTIEQQKKELKKLKEQVKTQGKVIKERDSKVISLLADDARRSDSQSPTSSSTPLSTNRSLR